MARSNAQNSPSWLPSGGMRTTSAASAVAARMPAVRRPIASDANFMRAVSLLTWEARAVHHLLVVFHGWCPITDRRFFAKLKLVIFRKRSQAFFDEHGHCCAP